MSGLLALRQKLNLTQEEVFEKTGISVRTIQRIEAGNRPKGYTLKALAKGLGVNEADLLENGEPTTTEGMPDDTSTKWLTIINLSVLPFIFIPPLNIAAPLLIMFAKKQFTPVARKIISIQIVWTLGAILLFIITLMLNDWFSVRSKFMLLIPLVWLLVNCIIIFRNAVEIAKNKTLRIFRNFSII